MNKMNDLYNPYQRLQLYFAWFSNDESLLLDENFPLGISMSRLCEITQLPIQVIRNDIIHLLKYSNKLLLELVEEDTNFTTLNPLYDLEHLWYTLPISPILENLILKGVLDFIPLHLIQNEKASFHLFLSTEEWIALDAYKQENNSFYHALSDISFSIKNSYHFIKCNYLQQKLELITQSIHKQYCLSMEYRTTKNHLYRLIFQPLKLVYDSSENSYAVISFSEETFQVYRLEHIEKLEIIKKNVKIQKEILQKLDNLLPNVWGLTFNEPPQRVKIKFYNEANVWSKVKNDLSYRTNGSLYKKDGFLFYEDNVYGISAFRSWIYSFGSSAIVIEPSDLRKTIIDSFQARLHQKSS